MEIIKTKQSRRDQTDFENLGFGEVFSDHMFSMEYKDGTPFARTVIVEFDSVKGRRETCLIAKLNEINSEVCEAIELIPQKERDKYLSQPGVN